MVGGLKKEGEKNNEAEVKGETPERTQKHDPREFQKGFKGGEKNVNRSVAKSGV